MDGPHNRVKEGSRDGPHRGREVQSNRYSMQVKPPHAQAELKVQSNR